VQTFVGRDEDCQVLSTLVAGQRPVTLVGPGGVGKTRLATGLSSRIQDRFPGGRFMVELSGATDQDDIGSVAARQLEVDSVEALLLRSADVDTLIVIGLDGRDLEGDLERPVRIDRRRFVSHRGGPSCDG